MVSFNSFSFTSEGSSTSYEESISDLDDSSYYSTSATGITSISSEIKSGHSDRNSSAPKKSRPALAQQHTTVRTNEGKHYTGNSLMYNLIDTFTQQEKIPTFMVRGKKLKEVQEFIFM